MVEPLDVKLQERRSRLQLPTLPISLFAGGRFERPIKKANPSLSFEPRCDSFRTESESTLNRRGVAGRKHSLCVKKEEKKKRGEEEGDGGADDAVLAKFAVLAAGIFDLWEGDESIRMRIELLMQRQEAMRERIRAAEEIHMEIKERLLALELQAEAERIFLAQLREERLRTLLHGKSTIDRGAQKLVCRPNPTLYLEDTVIFSSRQIVAFEILEFAHKRLTSHMWSNLWKKVQALGTEEDRAAYLSMFRGHGTPFGIGPMSEATYAQLLRFVAAASHINSAIIEAVEMAEQGLLDEASKEGYSPCKVGNISSQMAVYLQCQHTYKNWMETAHRTASSNVCDGYELTQEAILVVKEAAKAGKLGVLQPASLLIQLGCYFLCKCSSPGKV